MTEPTLLSPTFYIYKRLQGAWRRRYCGRRFGHFPVYDELGIYRSCGRCQAPML